MRLRIVIIGLILTVVSAHAQRSGNYNQDALAELYTVSAPSVDDIPDVTYRYEVLSGESNLWARNFFWEKVGRENLTLLQVLNRNQLREPVLGDSIVVPDKMTEDLRAYSPFPRYYPGAEQLDKLFIIHKHFQLYAAYEFGRLARWGVTSTGTSRLASTPAGRYNFNWREEFRISTESPVGQPWRLKWVFNFHLGRGIHTHQYPIPMFGPASHGCVRLTDLDSKWVYDWADGWQRKSGRVVKQGTMVLVLGEDPPNGAPPLFKPGLQPEPVIIELPEDPYSVTAGTSQQRMFDRRRVRQNTSATSR